MQIAEVSIRRPVFATVKHYVGNEQEIDRASSNSIIDERSLYQVYGLQYAVAQEVNPESVECAFNQVNGIWACENPIMNTNLRDDSKFDGYIMSDFGSVHSTAAALKAGLDQELNAPIWMTPVRLQAALDANEITVADIDKAAFRVIRSFIRNGNFDVLLPATAATDTATPAREAVALEAVQKSAVLLKNQSSVLPIDPTKVHNIALIGQTVSTTPTTQTPAVSARTVCAYGTRVRCTKIEDALTAFTAKAAANGQTITYVNGDDVAAATTAAQNADMAIVFGYYTGGENADMADLNFDRNGDALVAAVAAANPKTVVVSETGSAVVMPWINDVAGVVQAWYPGDQVGPGLASLFWGDTNFSGKLPMTFPKSLRDVPAQTKAQYPGVFADGSTVRPTGSTEIRQVSYSEGLQVGYKWYDEQDIDPLFEFGYGLSYSDFDYSDLTVTPSRGADGQLVSNVSFTVTNTSSRTGAEIPQVYLTLPDAADEPGKRLVGFDRITLAAGESTLVSLDVDAATADHPYGIWDVDADEWKDLDGKYTFQVGTSSRDLPLSETRTLEFASTAPVASAAVSPAAATGANGWYTSDVTVTASATDDVDTAPAVEVNVDGSGWLPATGAVTLSTDGTHTVQVRATDDSNNVSDVVTTTVKIDKTAPQAVASSDTTARTVTLQASDATSGVARIEYSTAAAPTTWTTYTSPIPVGRTAQSIVYRAIDTAGNVGASATFAYSPSVSVPAVGLAATAAKTVFGKTVTLTASVPADAVGSVEFFDGTKSLGSVAVAAGSASKVVSPTAGSHGYTAQFSGDPVYAKAGSLSTTVTVSKAKASSVKVSTTSVKRSGKQTVKATIGKLDNGDQPVGTAVLYVNGKKADSDKVTAKDKGKTSLVLTKKRSATFSVKVTFVPTDSDNIASTSSKSVKVKVAR